MRNFQGTFGTAKRSFISTFSICMTVPLRKLNLIFGSENNQLWKANRVNAKYERIKFNTF